MSIGQAYVDILTPREQQALAEACDWLIGHALDEKEKMPQAARTDMLIFDLGDLIATVKLTAWWGTDYLHLAKDREHWLIVNILRNVHSQDGNWLDALHGSV